MKDRDAPLLVEDILEAAGRLAEVVADGKQRFVDDWGQRSKVRDQLLIIGEASRRLTHFEGYAAFDPGWSFDDARKLRNRIAHEYWLMDLDQIWRALTHRVPQMAAELRAFRDAQK